MIDLVVGDLIGEHAVELVGVVAVCAFIVGVGVVASERPAVLSVVPLDPPAIEHREIGHSVDGGLHPRGSRGFHGRTRVVHPHIDALDHEPCHPGVVVLQDVDVPTEVV